jgi:predicted transcriptional regulator
MIAHGNFLVCARGKGGKIPKDPRTQIPKYPSTQVPKYPSTQVPKYPTTQPTEGRQANACYEEEDALGPRHVAAGASPWISRICARTGQGIHLRAQAATRRRHVERETRSRGRQPVDLQDLSANGTGNPPAGAGGYEEKTRSRGRQPVDLQDLRANGTRNPPAGAGGYEEKTRSRGRQPVDLQDLRANGTGNPPAGALAPEPRSSARCGASRRLRSGPYGTGLVGV